MGRVYLGIEVIADDGNDVYLHRQQTGVLFDW